MGISQYDPAARGRPARNAGRQVGAKRALKPRQMWTIRFYLDRERRMRDRALVDLAIDSKLRGCDLVKIKIGTLVAGTSFRAATTQIINERYQFATHTRQQAAVHQRDKRPRRQFR